MPINCAEETSMVSLTLTSDVKQTMRVDEGKRMDSLVGSSNMVRGPHGFPGPPGPAGPTGSVLDVYIFHYKIRFLDAV